MEKVSIKNLRVICISGCSEYDLQHSIDGVLNESEKDYGEGCELIDIKFSISAISDTDVVYSALITFSVKGCI